MIRLEIILMNKMIVMFGPPNSGKGTIGLRMSRQFGVPFVTAGDLVREKLATDEGWFEGRYSRELYDQGGFVPGDLMGRLITEKIIETNGTCILDGFPRTESQMRQFSDLGFPYIIIHIDQEDDVLIRRAMGRMICDECGEIYNRESPFMQPDSNGCCIKCGSSISVRSDDTPEAVLKRISKYRDETRPILDSLKENSLFWAEISPETNDVDAISKELADEIEKMISSICISEEQDTVATIKKYHIVDRGIAEECKFPGNIFTCRAIEEISARCYLHDWLENGWIEEIPFDVKKMTNEVEKTEEIEFDTPENTHPEICSCVPDVQYHTLQTVFDDSIRQFIFQSGIDNPLLDISFKKRAAFNYRSEICKNEEGDFPKYCLCVTIKIFIPTEGVPLSFISETKEFRLFVWEMKEEVFGDLLYEDFIQDKIEFIMTGIEARGARFRDVNTSLLEREDIPHGQLL